MTHVCCPSCRLRFSAGAVSITQCPACGGIPAARERAADVLGFRLAGTDESRDAVSLLLDDLPSPGS